MQNGKLVEPTDSKATAQAILDIILNKDRWQRYSSNGIKNILAYSWPSHCIQYLKNIEVAREDETLPRMATMHRRGQQSASRIEAIADLEEAKQMEEMRESSRELGGMQLSMSRSRVHAHRRCNAAAMCRAAAMRRAARVWHSTSQLLQPRRTLVECAATGCHDSLLIPGLLLPFAGVAGSPACMTCIVAALSLAQCAVELQRAGPADDAVCDGRCDADGSGCR
jgi:hypothetical protein